MNNMINYSAVSMVTILSIGLALFIEMALLKLVFSCLSRVNVTAGEADVEQARIWQSRRWVKRSLLNDLRNAGM